MAQFDVHLLPDGMHVVDVQSPIASVHPTRLVIPLVDPGADAAPIKQLNPRLMLDGEPLLLATHFMTTIDARLLKPPIGSVVYEEQAIKRAIDFLISGF